MRGEEFKFGYLSNGEKIVLFKRENLINFFDASLNLFKEKTETNFGSVSSLNSKTTNKIIRNQPIIENQNANFIFEIADKELLKTIKPLLNKNQVLQAVEITSKHYGNKYNSMTFIDWYKLVNELHKKITA